MKKFLIPVIVLVTGLPALAQSRSVMVSSPLAVHEVRRDLTLEQTALVRTNRIKSLLQPGARAKLDPVTREPLAHPGLFTEREIR
jgi:hypothetical protein